MKQRFIRHLLKIYSATMEHKTRIGKPLWIHEFDITPSVIDLAQEDNNSIEDKVERFLTAYQVYRYCNGKSIVYTNGYDLKATPLFRCF